MKSGVCVKCGSTAIHLVSKSVMELTIRIDWRSVANVCQYICTGCGYTEFFVEDKQLSKIAEKFPKVRG